MSHDAGGETPCVLVFRVGQLGDTLVSMPAIAVIRARHPGHRLVLVTEAQPAGSGQVSSWEVLGVTGWFDEVLYYASTGNALKKVGIMFSLARRIRSLRPAIVYDLAPERTARQSRRDRFFFQYLAGVREYRGGGLLLKPPKNAAGVLPRIEPEWKRLLRAVDGGHDAGGFRLSVPETERRQVRGLFRDLGIRDDECLVAVGPGSKMPAKVWPLERFRELGARLLRSHAGARLLVVGGKEDAAVGESLCAVWHGRAHNFSGILSLYGSAAVLEHCRVYVGNDSGAMHLAAMTGVPCVGIFSARDYPGQWEPYGTGHRVLRHETECAGCMLVVCPYHNKCLDLVSVDEVENAVNSILERTNS